MNESMNYEISRAIISFFPLLPHSALCSWFTMATNSNEILHDFSPLIRIYKDGRVERLEGEDTVAASIDPETRVESKDIAMAPEFNSVSARLYLPQNAKPGHRIPLLVYFHGGGFVVGSAFSPVYQEHLNSLVAEANVIVVSVNYRLAPEHPLPIAYEDSWLALKWIASHSKSGDGPEEWLKNYADFDRVYFGGDSAGGNIAHNMAFRFGIEELHGVNLNGIFLNCPYFWGNDPIANEAGRKGEKNFLDNLWFCICPSTTGLDDPRLNPAANPMISRLGCKRVLVYVGGKDVLKDRGWYYKEALEKSGWAGEVTAVEVEGEEHVFNLSSPRGANSLSMIKDLARFLNRN
ncbi:probable carboxylesterase 7 [Coffea arabica]|uniref:Probable carboxylesterase 7 n=1 Tax=Coffea arabica TaxID=13443 RepID=A0A6P6VTV3_COFAR|nr:probable carboxylesterase 7 [Coffea arabica]